MENGESVRFLGSADVARVSAGWEDFSISFQKRKEIRSASPASELSVLKRAGNAVLLPRRVCPAVIPRLSALSVSPAVFLHCPALR